jgi:transposase
LNQLREWAADGLSIRQISKRLGLSRNTVRKFLRSTPDPPSWPQRGSILDPFKPRDAFGHEPTL